MRVAVFLCSLALAGCIQFDRAGLGSGLGSDSGADAAAVVLLPWLCEDGSGPSECCSNFDCRISDKGDLGFAQCIGGVCVTDCVGVECCTHWDGLGPRTCTASLPHCNHNVCEATCLPECGGRECGSGPNCGGKTACGECAPGVKCVEGNCRP